MRYRKCDICESESFNILLRNKFKEFNLSIVECSKCGFIYQREVYSKETLKKLYANDNGHGSDIYKENNILVSKCLNKRRQFISFALKKSKGSSGKILDIGGGSGEFIAHIKNKELYVVDITNIAACNEKINKINILFDDYVTNDKFDLIVMNHILEHVFDVKKVLLKAKEMLTENGILLIEVPMEILTPKLLKNFGDWRHVNYFSTCNLKYLINNINLNIEYIKIENSCYLDRHHLPVIRLIARKIDNKKEEINYEDCKYSSYLNLINPIYLYHYVIGKLK